MFINMKDIIYDIYETEKDDVDLSSFDLKDELNDRFWHDNKLDIRARRKLLTIARDFINEFELKDFPIYDVIMTGSLANYNWSEEHVHNNDNPLESKGVGKVCNNVPARESHNTSKYLLIKS